MTVSKRLVAGVFLATALLGAGTIGLASVPPRPLRSALTVVHTLSFRVATDWLAVVALLAVGERYVSAGKTVNRTTVRRLAAAVFLGGLAIEASPLIRHVVEPAAVGTAPLVRGLVTAVQRALFPTGLFVATVAGAAAISDAHYGRVRRAKPGGLPLAPAQRRVPAVATVAVLRVTGALAVAAGSAFLLEAGLRVALGAPYFWFAIVDAGLGALASLVSYLVLAVAFLVLVVDGVRSRSLVGETALLWVALFGTGVLVALLSGVLGVVLVSVTATPMGTVEAARLGQWPAPDSWALLLQIGTFLAGAVGLRAIHGTDTSQVQQSEAGTTADPQDA